MSYKHIFCFLVSTGFIFSGASTMNREEELRYARAVVESLNSKVDLPARGAAEFFLKGLFPDFAQSQMANSMLDEIYRRPDINNGDVGSQVFEKVSAYVKDIKQPLQEGEKFPGEKLYGRVEQFFVWQPDNSKITLPDEETFLDQLNAREPHFCSHFGLSLKDYLYVDNMTKSRAQKLVVAAILIHMRSLVSSNPLIAKMWALMEYDKQIKDFILGEEQA